jgi:hypothetical protein
VLPEAYVFPVKLIFPDNNVIPEVEIVPDKLVFPVKLVFPDNVVFPEIKINPDKLIELAATKEVFTLAVCEIRLLEEITVLLVILPDADILIFLKILSVSYIIVGLCISTRFPEVPEIETLPPKIEELATYKPVLGEFKYNVPRFLKKSPVRRLFIFVTS